MANQQVEMIQEKTGSAYHYVTGTAQRAFLASLGAVALVGDQAKGLWSDGGEFAGKLVERGEGLATNGRERVDTVVGGRQDQVQEQVSGVTNRANETFEKYSEAVLTRVNMPSANDIDALGKKINTLNRKIDKVIKEQAKTA